MFTTTIHIPYHYSLHSVCCLWVAQASRQRPMLNQTTSFARTRAHQ